MMKIYLSLLLVALPFVAWPQNTELSKAEREDSKNVNSYCGETGPVDHEASQAMFAPVTILRDTNQGIWVSGLPEKADIIVVGQEYVTDGVPVRATYREVTQ